MFSCEFSEQPIFWVTASPCFKDYTTGRIYNGQKGHLIVFKNSLKICPMYVIGLLITSREFTLEKTKLNLSFFSIKNRKNVGTIDINYNGIKIKQYSKVACLGWELDENLSVEAMAVKVINKINDRLRFLYRKNRYTSGGCFWCWLSSIFK